MFNEVLSQQQLNGKLFQVVQGDLTLEEGAIVNPANGQLRHGGGAALAIARKGGIVIDEESQAWIAGHGSVETGHVAFTNGGNLPAKFVIHAVGPIWGSHDGQEAELLRNAVREAIVMAELLRVGSIAIPAISSGIYGGDKQECCNLIVAEAAELILSMALPNLCAIRFIANDEVTAQAFVAALDAVRD